MILFFALLHFLPVRESCVYETYDKGHMDSIVVESRKDSIGYNVRYVWDREIVAIFDTLDLSTLYMRKIVNGKLELEIKKDKKFNVYFKGRESQYNANDPIYDRHSLEFPLRGFDYHPGFKKIFRLHVPEFMVVNAELEVTGEQDITTSLGTFRCWEVTMKPRVIFLNRKFFFYIEKEYPHRFVKYMDSGGENIITLIEYHAE